MKHVIRKAIENGAKRFKWPLCETCGHGRSCHAPDAGVGWRCRYRKKRGGQQCDCMRYKGTLHITY